MVTVFKNGDMVRYVGGDEYEQHHYGVLPKDIGVLDNDVNSPSSNGDALKHVRFFRTGLRRPMYLRTLEVITDTNGGTTLPKLRGVKDAD